MKRLALAGVALAFAACINFDDVVKECESNGRCVKADAGMPGGGAGGGGGGGGGSGGGAAADAGPDAGSDAGLDAGTDAGVDGGVDAGCQAQLCFVASQRMPVWIYAIDALPNAEDDLYAVGGNPTLKGHVFHFDGTAWSEVDGGETTQQLFAVDVTIKDHVWAAGTSSLVRNSLNAPWSTIPGPLPVNELRGIWSPVAAGGTPYAVSFEGNIWHQDMLGTWNPEFSDAEKFQTIWGTTDTNVWAGGYYGTVLYRTAGGTWQRADAGIPFGDYVESIWGFGSSSVYFATYFGRVVAFDGSTFQMTQVGARAKSLRGTGPGALWLAGGNTNELHFFDGGTWSRAAFFDAGTLPDGGATFGIGPQLLHETPTMLFLVSDVADTSVIHQYRIRR